MTYRIVKVFAVALTVVTASGCEVVNRMTTQAERTDLAPINVSGTSYTVYKLEVKHPDPITAEPVVGEEREVAVYANVGGGFRVYCGRTRAGCEAAIRAFNASPTNIGELSDEGDRM